MSMFDRNIKIQFNRMKYSPLTQKRNLSLIFISNYLINPLEKFTNKNNFKF